MSLEQELREWTRQEYICQCVELTQRAADRIRVLEAALIEYARHHEPCPWWSHKPCTCGLDKVAPGSDTKTEVDAAAERVMGAIEIGMGECGFKRSRWKEP